MEDLKHEDQITGIDMKLEDFQNGFVEITIEDEDCMIELDKLHSWVCKAKEEQDKSIKKDSSSSTE